MNQFGYICLRAGNRPSAKIFVNNNITTIREADEYKDMISRLLSQGVSIDGIGVHGHFDEIADRNVIRYILDKLSAFNIPIWITEYDSNTSDENKRADNLENLYRIAFGHPSVEGIVMWGFWEGVHWRGQNGAILNLDWTPNAAGRRFESLMKEWTTNTSGNTDKNGNYNFRGFHGGYRITVTVPGKGQFNKSLTLTPNKDSLNYKFVID